MGKRYLIDSNPLIEFSGGLLPEYAHRRLSSMIDQEFNISFITKIEVLGHISADHKLNDFISLATVFGFNEDIIQQTIFLRKSYKIKIPDALIASTALVYNLTLVTRNITDFRKIPGIDLLNLYEE